MAAREQPIPAVVRQRRWWLVLLALWAAVVASAWRAQVEDIRGQAVAVAIEGARNMFRMVLLTRKWNASHGGIYVPVTPRVQPNAYLEHPRRDVTTRDGVALTMINPAYMTRLIGEMASTDNGAVFRLTSRKPTRPGNAPDVWEREALLAFEAGAREAQAVLGEGEARMLRYMAPLYVEESCLGCHQQQGYKVGQIRGGLSVSQRYAPIEAAGAAAIDKAGLSHGAVFLLVALLGWVGLEVLRRRWLELAGKVREVEATQGQLLQSEKLAAVGQLAAGVAHEINNPMGFIMSNVGTMKLHIDTLASALQRQGTLLAPYLDERPELREQLALLAQEMDLDFVRDDLPVLVGDTLAGLTRVKRVVQDLREFSAVDQAAWQVVDLNACLKTAAGLLGDQLDGRIRLVWQLGELPPVDCNAPQINQVLRALLLNAAQAIDGTGAIIVTTRESAGWVELEIADSGHGIAPEDLPRVFEPFFTTRPVGHGMGLGLTVAYQVIKRHGGCLAVDCPPAGGTCVSVNLPVRRQAVADAL